MNHNGIASSHNPNCRPDNGIASGHNGIASGHNPNCSADSGIASSHNGIVSADNLIAADRSYRDRISSELDSVTVKFARVSLLKK